MFLILSNFPVYLLQDLQESFGEYMYICELRLMTASVLLPNSIIIKEPCSILLC